MTQIFRTTPVEDLVQLPGAVDFMVRNGLPCLVCGEPAWGTFEDVARSRGRSPEEIDLLLAELNRRIERPSDAHAKSVRGPSRGAQ